MALRTTSTRATLQGKSRRYAEMGYDTVLVSQYGMCSETCLPWQGRAYIDDVFRNWDGEKNGEMGKSKYCGKWFTLLSAAIKGGLFHPNCRHSMDLYVDGKPLPGAVDNSESERLYKLEQKQRRLENEVRKIKRKAEGFSDPDNIKKASKELREAQKRLVDFIKEVNEKEGKLVLKPDYDRERIYENPVDFSDGNGIIEEKTDGTADKEVHNVGKIDIEKYKCVTEDIQTDEVIITEKQIEHIKERHPNDYERYFGYVKEIIQNPDYILEANKPDTAFVLKHIVDNGKNYQLILRLKTSNDPTEYKNSVITFLKVDNKKWAKYLRNKNIIR